MTGAERVEPAVRALAPAFGASLVAEAATGTAGNATGARKGVGCVTLCVDTTGVVGLAAAVLSLYCVPIFIVAPEPD